MSLYESKMRIVLMSVTSPLFAMFFIQKDRIQFISILSDLCDSYALLNVSKICSYMLFIVSKESSKVLDTGVSNSKKMVKVPFFTTISLTKGLNS